MSKAIENTAFITAVLYDDRIDTIRVEISDALKKHIANVHISFDTPHQTAIYLAPIDNDAVQALPFTNSVMLLAAVVVTLERHTTPETEIALVIDVEEPIAITL